MRGIVAGDLPYHDHSKPFLIPGARGGDSEMGMASRGPTMEIGAELGLMGHLIVDTPSARRPDREIYLVFHDVYANDVPNLDGDVDCFNGAAFLGNTPTFHAKVGEHVRWHVFALGTEFHVFHLHGHRWEGADGRYVDSYVLGPSTSLEADYIEDNPGEWLYHCHVVDHMVGGMVGRYQVAR
jgi:manganese oxidase